MARTLPFRSRWHAAGAGMVATLALTSAVVLAAVSGSSASERDRVGTHETDDRVIVCESGVISHGDVDTSSAVATRAPAGALVPAGCREG